MVIQIKNNDILIGHYPYTGYYDWPGTAIHVTAISFSSSNNAIVKNNSIIDSTDASVSGINPIDSNYINIYATEENSAVSGNIF